MTFWIKMLIIISIVIISIYFISTCTDKKRKPKKITVSKRPASKPFFSTGLKEAIRWSIFLLICLILIMYLFNFGYSSYKSITNNSDRTNNITNQKQSSKQVLGYINVSFNGKYGNRVYLYQNFPKNARFQFIDATVDYIVINKLNKMAFAIAGQNASGQLGLSNGNIWLRFKSLNEEKGTLRIKVYLKK